MQNFNSEEWIYAITAFFMLIIFNMLYLISWFSLWYNINTNDYSFFNSEDFRLFLLSFFWIIFLFKWKILSLKYSIPYFFAWIFIWFLMYYFVN